MNIVTFSQLRKNLKEIMDVSTDHHEPVIIKRSNQENMILLSLRDYESLEETAHLLSSEANVRHLKKSLNDLKTGHMTEKKLIEKWQQLTSTAASAPS